MISFKHSGDFSETERYLKAAKRKNFHYILERFAMDGVNALIAATPIDSGFTADSWHYEIITSPTGFKIYWTNRNVVDGVPVAILIQYGHGTKSGSFVEGRDFINPAMQPIFDRIAEELWKEASRL